MSYQIGQYIFSDDDKASVKELDHKYKQLWNYKNDKEEQISYNYQDLMYSMKEQKYFSSDTIYAFEMIIYPYKEVDLEVSFYLVDSEDINVSDIQSHSQFLTKVMYRQSSQQNFSETFNGLDDTLYIKKNTDGSWKYVQEEPKDGDWYSGRFVLDMDNEEVINKNDPQKAVVVFKPSQKDKYTHLLCYINRVAQDNYYSSDLDGLAGNGEVEGRALIADTASLYEIQELIDDKRIKTGTKDNKIIPLQRIGVHGKNGTILVINGERINIDRAGVYELNYTINSLGVYSIGNNTVKCSIDYVYDKGEN